MEDHSWLLLLLYLASAAATDCLFPAEWRGTWYDNRLKTFEISGTSISRKGTCVQREDNKFLLLNKGTGNEKCFKCVVFTEWHPNLLQYKESFCWPEESLGSVCNKITGDIPLQTIVKVNSIPEPCPFQGSYTFSYANGTVEKCENPPSEIRACADESKFRFVYRHCPQYPGTYDQELDFQCLATWTNGDKFLYGRFSQPGDDSSFSNRYRCFMHSLYGSTGDMAMSADPTCQGLQSSTLGVVTMKLNKDMSTRHRGSCKFPELLVNQNKWRDLSGHIRMEVDDGLQVIRIKDRHPDDKVIYGAHATRIVFQCVNNLGITRFGPAGTYQVEYIAHATNDSCVSEQMCLLFKRRSRDVIELLTGYTVNGSQTDCEYRHGNKFLFIPEGSRASTCPRRLAGVYQYTDKASDCSGEVNLGCQETKELIVHTRCQGNTEAVKILKCLQSWGDGRTSYTIVQQSETSSSSLLCLTFMKTEFGTEVQADTTCEGDRRVVINHYLNLLLYTPPASCSQDAGGLQADQNKGPAHRVIDGDGGRGSAAPRAPCLYFLVSVVICRMVILGLR